MLRTIIVDDEDLIREGLIAEIDWNSVGYEVIGEAEDGEQALELVRELRPELVISDIKMPFMDGLQFIEHTKLEYPDTYIIILSGHDEFQYAQRAIQLGAFEYMLKPIESDDLKRVLLRIREDHEAKQSKQEDLLLLKRQVTERLPEEYIDDEWKTALRLADKSMINEKLDRWTTMIQEQGSNSYLFMQIAIGKLYKQILNTVKENGGPVEEVLGAPTEVYTRILAQESAQDMIKQLRGVLSAIVDNIEARRGGRNDEIIHKAKTFIKIRYSDDRLSLEEVSNAVNMSPSYFSVLFKQKVGENFIDYLTAVRIQHACELLQNTGYKTYEIAEMTGYSNPTYFSTIFKKMKGLSPTEYRHNIRMH
jgi:two-component system response regulator YesN